MWSLFHGHVILVRTLDQPRTLDQLSLEGPLDRSQHGLFLMSHPEGGEFFLNHPGTVCGGGVQTMFQAGGMSFLSRNKD